MSRLPRIAVGTVQPGCDGQLVVWALMEALRRGGIQVQSFLSRACFPALDGAAAVTGLSPRHLDSWLMSAEVCQDIFVRGAQSADLAVVEGRYHAAGADRGGQLDTLCQWLDLPRLAIVDAARLPVHGLPPRPDVEGILLDRVADDRQRAWTTTDIEALWGIPVLGSLDQLSELRRRLATLPNGSRPPADICRRLGEDLLRHWRPQRLGELACGRELAAASPPRRRVIPAQRQLKVAVAYDAAFHRYFPDTLDWLEFHGASIVDFSPLRDEGLPADTDIVYIGCGYPERHADALADNHCMKAALRGHLRAGRRIYAEGGGLVYLCHQMDTGAGRTVRMAGIIPALARPRNVSAPPQAVEVTLARSNWLGDADTRLRGYRHPAWRLEPCGPLHGFVAEADHRFDLVGSFQVVGSLLHLNFAAEPGCLRHFFEPRAPGPAEADPLGRRA